MLTIIITAAIVAILGLVLWKTKGFKKLRDKNRAQEKKEDIVVNVVAKTRFEIEPSKPAMAEIPPPECNYSDTPATLQETTTEITQSYTITNTMTIPHELPIKLPATIRPEIVLYYDDIKKNIKNYDVIYDHNNSFRIKSKDNVVKSIKVTNGEIEIKELSSRFVLLDKETNLFINLAREEFERRVVQDEIDTANKLKGISVA